MQGRTLGSRTLEVFTLSRPLAAPLEVEEKGDTYAMSAHTAGPSTSRVRSSPLGSALLAYRHAHPSSPATILSLQVATSVRRLYAGDTPILMADGHTKPLADLRVGDRIYGTERRGNYRRYVPTVVLDHWSTMACKGGGMRGLS